MLQNLKIYTEYTNISVYNTTIYFIYIQNSVSSGRHVSTFTGSSSGPQRKRIRFIWGPENDPVKAETFRPDDTPFWSIWNKLLCYRHIFVYSIYVNIFSGWQTLKIKYLPGRMKVKKCRYRAVKTAETYRWIYDLQNQKVCKYEIIIFFSWRYNPHCGVVFYSPLAGL